MASNSENNAAVVYITVIFRTLTRLALIVGAAYVLWRAQSILISLLVSILLTYALLPAIECLCRKPVVFLKLKTQRLVATMLVFITFIGLSITGVAIIVTPFSNEIGNFTKNFKDYGDQIQKIRMNAEAWYDEAIPDDVKPILSGATKKVIDKLEVPSATSWLSKAGPQAAHITSSWIHFAMELFLIPVLAFYFALDYKALAREFYGLIPKNRVREFMRLGRDAGAIMQSYIVGQFILCVIAAIVTAAFLGILQMPYIVVLALFAGITRAIPVIGPVVSGIPIVLVGMLNSQGIAIPIYLLIFVTFLHFAESKFIMPRLIGYRMHLHPAVVIVVLLIGAEFFGVIGMFLAAPVAAIIRELIRLYYIIPKQRSRKPVPADHIGAAHTTISL